LIVKYYRQQILEALELEHKILILELEVIHELDEQIIETLEQENF
jgi:hypothetical protein